MNRKELLEAYKAKTNEYKVPGHTTEDIEKIYGKNAGKYIISCPVCGNNMFAYDYCNECGYSEYDIFSCSDELIEQYKEDYQKKKRSQKDYVWFVDVVQQYKWRT